MLYSIPKYFTSYTIKLYCYQDYVLERVSRNRKQRIFRKVRTIHIQNLDQKMNFFLTLMKLRLGLLFKDLSQQFGIELVVFALKFFIHGHGYDCRKIKI